jgi:NAD(P)-dependent dehydrogenase (short-subunit alcohol dehydrogenase family)
VNWELEGNVALVTGAAAGIGAAIARQLADAGAVVIGADRAWDEAASDGVQPVRLDVTDRAAVRDAIEAIVADRGGLDLLVNNAGTMRARDLLDYDDEDWDAVFAVNARAVFACIQEAARAMGERGGAIVNVASVAGRDGKTLSPPYAASKAAVINLTRSTARLLAPQGIRVNAVCPGLIDTEFNARLGRQLGPAEGLTAEEFVAKRAETIPIGRIGTADDVARVVCFLASPAAGYVTGQSVNVDGGWVMS